MIKVAIADDHTILRKGIVEIINKFGDMVVVAEAVNGKELVELLEKLTELPDICILDINMPVLSGYETAVVIKKRWKNMYLLALSMYDKEYNIIKMLRSGAGGYVLKDSDPEELKKAIISIVETGNYFSDLAPAKMFKMLDNQDRVPIIELNERERKFLELCCTERSYKEIADIMHCSPRTIDDYREKLFQKLGTTTRTGLAMYAIRSGLVTL